MGLGSFFRSVRNVVSNVVDTVGDVVKEVGNVVEKAVDTVVKTVKQIIKDPLPMIETIGLSMMGVPPSIAAAMVTKANGGSWGDAVKNGAMVYAGSQIASTIAPSVSNALADTGASASTIAGASKALTSVALAEITGKDPMTALVSSMVNSTVGGALKTPTQADVNSNMYAGNPPAQTDVPVQDTLANDATVKAAETNAIPPSNASADAIIQQDFTDKPTPQMDTGTGNIPSSPAPTSGGLGDTAGGLGDKVTNYLTKTGVGALSGAITNAIVGQPTAGQPAARQQTTPAGGLTAATPDTATANQPTAQKAAAPIDYTKIFSPAAAEPYSSSPLSFDKIRPVAPTSAQAWVQPVSNAGQASQVQPLWSGLDPQTTALRAKRGGIISPLSSNISTLSPDMIAGPDNKLYAKHQIRGFAVGGRGTGQSDDIPTMLSDGEFVISADVVSALGDGSSKAGSDKLYTMMKEVRNRYRGADSSKIPPVARSPLEYMKSTRK
jgi:hypothetical protein